MHSSPSKEVRPVDLSPALADLDVFPDASRRRRQKEQGLRSLFVLPSSTTIPRSKASTMRLTLLPFATLALGSTAVFAQDQVDVVGLATFASGL